MSKEFFSVYRASLGSDLCREIIGRFEESPHTHQGLVGDGSAEGKVDLSIKQTTELIIDNRPEWQDVLGVLHQSLREQLKVYLGKWGIGLKNVDLIPEVFRIQKYEPGGFFDWHSDNVGGALERVITVIWYLNKVEEGGATEYPWQGVKIDPNEGDLLLCPVGWTYLHRGAPPISGDKYIVITQMNQRPKTQPSS